MDTLTGLYLALTIIFAVAYALAHAPLVLACWALSALFFFLSLK